MRKEAGDTIKALIQKLRNFLKHTFGATSATPISPASRALVPRSWWVGRETKVFGRSTLEVPGIA
jgi:hypothetical protein